MKHWNYGDDILDTRDLEERLTELEALEIEVEDARDEYIELSEEIAGATQQEIDDAHERYKDAVENFSAEDAEELKFLRDFKSEMEGYCDWIHGETLIHEDYKIQYAEDLATDIGAISREPQWPLQHIDWEAAANQLFDSDYHYADLGHSTYYARTC